MAADTIAKAHLLLIILGIAVNRFFALGAEAVLEGLGKAYNEAWPAEDKGV